MIGKLINASKLAALLALENSGTTTRLGTVDSYDPDYYTCKVRIQPENTLTGWLPVTSQWIGNGWGLFCPPTAGDLVEVQFVAGNPNMGFVCLRFFNDDYRPLAVPSGELWLVHQSGAYLKLTNDGKVSINAAAEIDIGALGSALHQLVTDAFMALYNGHTHPAGNGNTGAPNQQMTSSHLTGVLKAN